jgi:hypothetical protein
MALVLGLVALVAAAASIAAAEVDRVAPTRRLEAAACAGVTIPTAPAGSSIMLFYKGEPEATALAASGSPALVRAGAALSQALGESNNAKSVVTALTDAAKECRVLGLHTPAGS